MLSEVERDDPMIHKQAALLASEIFEF